MIYTACCDALEGLSQINHPVDFICTDPPYNIRYSNKDYIDQFTHWDELAKMYHTILSESGNVCIFAGWSSVNMVIQDFSKYFVLRNWIIWDRVKGRGASKNFTSTREDILWFSKTDNYTFNKEYSNTPKKTKGMGLKNGQLNRSLSNVWTDISPIVPWSSEYTGYASQKPVNLMKRLIRIFSNEGDIVLDTFCGSGSTAVAALQLNRGVISFDTNAEAVAIANKRIREMEEKFDSII